MISFFSLCCTQVILSFILFPLIAATLIQEFLSRRSALRNQFDFRKKNDEGAASRLKKILDNPFFKSNKNLSYNSIQQTINTLKIVKKNTVDYNNEIRSILQQKSELQKRFLCFPFLETGALSNEKHSIIHAFFICILLFSIGAVIYYLNPGNFIPPAFTYSCIPRNSLLFFGSFLFISICSITCGQLRPTFYDSIVNFMDGDALKSDRRGIIQSLLIKVFKCIVNALGAFLRIFTEVAEMNWLFSLGVLLLFVVVGILFFHNLPDIAKWTGKIFLLVFLIQCLVNMVRNYLLPHAKRICSPKQIMINILLALGALPALFSVIYATTVLLRPHPSGSVLFYVDHISEFSFQMKNLFISF